MRPTLLLLFDLRTTDPCGSVWCHQSLKNKEATNVISSETPLIGMDWQRGRPLVTGGLSPRRGLMSPLSIRTRCCRQELPQKKHGSVLKGWGCGLSYEAASPVSDGEILQAGATSAWL